MKRLCWLFLALVLLPFGSLAQTSEEAGAAKNIQPSQSETLRIPPPTTALKIPAGTTIEIEVAYTVNEFFANVGYGIIRRRFSELPLVDRL